MMILEASVFDPVKLCYIILRGVSNIYFTTFISVKLDCSWQREGGWFGTVGATVLHRKSTKLAHFQDAMWQNKSVHSN